MDLTINSPRLAGRLAQCISNWQKITQDGWILPGALTDKANEQRKISEEFKVLLSKGAITEATISTESLVSKEGVRDL